MATSETWTGTLKNLDPDTGPDHANPGPSKTWTTQNLDPQKRGINMRLKNMSDFRGLYFIKTMRNVICFLKVSLLTDM